MNKKLLTKTPVVCGLAIICCLLWGSAFPCIKIGYQMFNIPSGAVGSQFLFAGIRFTCRYTYNSFRKYFKQKNTCTEKRITFFCF